MTERLLNETQRIRQLIFNRNLKDIFLLVLGILLASIGLKGFLLPNNFLDGGATGVALLAQIASGWDLSLLILLVNIPFIFIAVRQISPVFALRSALGIVGLAIAVHFVEFPTVTQDKLLIAVFGGFFLGAGIGFSIRAGAVLDGTEILAIFISRRSSLTVGDFITLFNVVLFSLALIFVSMETAMYCMLTYFSASKAIDFLLNGIEEYIGITIISNEYAEIKTRIRNELGRAVTVYKSDSGFEGNGAERKILFCVVTRLEVSKILLEIDKVDEKAFVIQHSIRETKGGMLKRRAHAH